MIVAPSGEQAIGRHNANLEASRDRLLLGGTYKDQSTVCVIPTRGQIHARVVQSWFALLTGMNQKFLRMFVMGREVADAYNEAIGQILASPDLSQWKYVLTLEEDNMPQADSLLRLYEAIEAGPFDAVGGLYWTKGEGGQPMIYGNPAELPRNYAPQIPVPGRIQPCNGLGMGFTLFRMSLFKDERIQRPWFKTVSEYQPGVGCRVGTQDLYFFENASKHGYLFASDNRAPVGHYDANLDVVW